MKPTKKSGVAPEPTQQAIATYDWGQSQATGFEKVNTDDLGIPFLMILQSGSPEIKVSHKDHVAKKIAGATEGCIINTVTRQILYTHGEEPVLFIPCAYEKLYVEWKKRGEGAGGGFVRSHTDPLVLRDCHRNEKNQDELPNGNIIMTTAYFYGLVNVNDAWEKVVIGMTSTQLKKARNWLNMAMAIKIQSPTRGLITPPLFSHKYALGTTPENNEAGSWFGWTVESAGMIENKDLISQCFEITKKISQGNRPQIGAGAAAPDEVPI